MKLKSIVLTKGFYPDRTSKNARMTIGEKGLVSVIVPTHNRGQLLLEAMESVYTQTYRPIELIVVDDGSTDATPDITHKWAEEHCCDDGFRFTYLFQANAGAPAARNVGLVESHGEFIQFLDSDDFLYPKRLDRLIKLFNETSCDYIYTGIDRVCSQCGQVIQSHLPKAASDHLTVLCEGFLWGSTLQFCWRRELVEKIGNWDTNMMVYQDYDYVIRTVLASTNGIALREILSRERMGGGARISDVRTTDQGCESFLRAAGKLCSGVMSPNIPLVARKKLSSYLYYRALLTYPKCPAIGKRIGKLARSVGCTPNSTKGFINRFVWHTGKFLHVIHLLALDVKSRLYRLVLNNKGAEKHICSHARTR